MSHDYFRGDFMRKLMIYRRNFAFYQQNHIKFRANSF